MEPVPPRRTDVTDLFFSRLDADRARAAINQEGLDKLEGGALRRAIINRVAREAPELLAPAGLKVLNVPAGLHQIADQRAGDLYFPDLFAEMVVEHKLEFPPGAAALDFGCSTGRVVRNLALFYPDRKWFGCDPRADSIAWAAQAIPDVMFFVNAEVPPLTYDERTFCAVLAISVWSHFSKERALAWFEEIARVTQKGGFLIFTTHGECSVNHYSAKGKMPPQRVELTLQRLEKGAYTFRPYPRSEDSRGGVDLSHWGMAFAPPSWYRRNVGKWWIVKEYLPGRAMGNQDVYLLVRK